MRFFLLIATLLFFLSSSFGAIKGIHDHFFAVEGDYVLLRRAKSLSKSLVQAAGGPLTVSLNRLPVKCRKEPGKTLISSRDLVNNMHFDPGIRVSLKLFFGIHSTLALTYTGGFHWLGQETISCMQNLNLPGDLGKKSIDYHFANRAKTVYRSAFYITDLSYIKHVTPRYADHFSVSLIASLNFLQIDEKLNLYFSRNSQTSRFRVKTFNRTFGPSIGGILEYNPSYFSLWGLNSQLGGLVNRGKQKTLMLDQGNTSVTIDAASSGTNFAYFFKIYPYIEFRFVKFFNFKVSYEVLYIGRVALADHQLRYRGGHYFLNHNGNVIYHGLYAALQFNF